MQPEDLVVSCSLAKRLKELQVKQESLFYWWQETGSSPTLRRLPTDDLPCYSAFTVAELGQLLPQRVLTRNIIWELRIRKIIYEWEVSYAEWPRPTDQRLDTKWISVTNADREADARAKCLIQLLEQKLIAVPAAATGGRQ